FLTYPATRAAFREYFSRWKPVLKNLISSDVYTMASAISTCAVLSFFPFTILLISIMKNLLHFDTATEWIGKMIEAYIPSISPTVTPLVIATDIQKHSGSAHLQVISALILLASAIGVFVPIEVTLNRIWNAHENMSFIKNQIVSFSVVVVCGLLSLFSFLIGGISLWIIKMTLGRLPFPSVEGAADLVSVKVVGFLLSMTLFLLVFRFLPNIRMPMDILVRASIFTGVIWELGKYAFVWILQRLDLSAIYGAFFTAAVVLILWSYVSAMIMILGAELAHRELLSLRLFRPAWEEWSLLDADSSRSS
ncbi:MAG TPA: YihY/virulence factor BrkB family protein, partial [Terriglobia bacterium]|nr:YihY/virulence factor BrkB family protein [Terriglobia bacterium]